MKFDTIEEEKPMSKKSKINDFMEFNSTRKSDLSGTFRDSQIK